MNTPLFYDERVFCVSLDITFRKNLLNMILYFNKTAYSYLGEESAMLTGVIICICNQHAEACRKPHHL